MGGMPGPDLAALQCRGERRRYMGIAAMTLRLHGYPVRQYFNAARAALIEKGTDFQVIPNRAAQDDAFLAPSAMGKIPYLVTPPGSIAETVALLASIEEQSGGFQL